MIGMNSLIADNKVIELIERLKEIKAMSQSLKKEEDKIKVKLNLLMLDREELITEDGELLMTYKATKDVEYFDMTRFKFECPELYKAFIELRAGSKRIVLK